MVSRQVRFWLQQLVGPRKRTATKLMPYECGKDPVGSARDRFSIKFYTVAVFFLLFDIEVLFMIPFAVAFKSLLAEEKNQWHCLRHQSLCWKYCFYRYARCRIFYVWKKGTFDWSIQARAEARAEAHELVTKKQQRIQELKRAA